MKRKIKVSIFILVVVVVGFGLRHYSQQLLPEQAIKENLGIVTRVLSAEKGDLVKEIKYIGTVEAGSTTDVSPLVTADVKSIYVQEGQVIAEGDIIGQLDDMVVSNSLDTIYSKLETLKGNYSYLNSEVNDFYKSNAVINKIENLEYESEFLKDEITKYTTLYESGSISKSQLDKFIHDRDVIEIQINELEASASSQYDQLLHERNNARSQIKEIESEINGVNNQVDQTVLISPRSGIVRKIYYEIGELAIMGKPFITIDEEDNYVVKVNIAESDLKKMSIETTTNLSYTEGGSHKAQMTKFPRTIDPMTRIGEIEIDVTELFFKENLMIGSSVEVSFVIDEVNDRIILPKKAVKTSGDMDFVYIVEDNTIRRQAVELGLAFNDQIEIISGIKPEDIIAYENLNKLYEGAKVFIFEGDE